VSDVKVNKNKKDQMFFHDLINQTHGLLLFLESKHSLDTSEINLIKNEIKLLQGLAQDHYQLNHKNLETSKDNENQEQKIVKALTTLVSTYFPGQENSFQISTHGHFDGVVDFIALYRILNNIVKNMAEAHIQEAKFVLDFSEKGVSFSTENPIKDLNSPSREDGIGLFSIASIAKNSGGIFHYEIHSSSWKNHVFLPYQSPLPIKKIAA
jgi:hypothetical protein